MTTKTRPRLTLDVCVSHDDDTQSPLEEDAFSLVSVFSGGQVPVIDKHEEMKDQGRGEGRSWWWVSCYRHGGEHWFLEGETPIGADHWDTTKRAGILYLETGNPDDVGPTPQEAAESILEEYNRWLSGDTWCWAIQRQVETPKAGNCPCCETPDVNWYETTTEDYDNSGGFIGLEYTLEDMASALKGLNQDDPDNVSRYEVVISGDDAGRAYASDVADKVREVGFRVEGDPDHEVQTA